MATLLLIEHENGTVRDASLKAVTAAVQIGGPLHALAFVAKTLWFYTLTRRRPARIGLAVRAWRDALRGDFTGHRRFIR